MCMCLWGVGGHAEEAAYWEMEGLLLTQSLCPSIIPRAWSPILYLAPDISPTSGGGPCSSPFYSPLNTVSANHSLGPSPKSPGPCPGLQGREERKVLAGGITQHWELLVHLSDNHAVHLALG